MTDNNTDPFVLAQRKVATDQNNQATPETELKPEIDLKEQSQEPTKPKTRQEFDAAWKYYWYIFRYYHFKVADTIDLYASAACLWVINLYLRLFMGIGPEPPSALTEE